MLSVRLILRGSGTLCTVPVSTQALVELVTCNCMEDGRMYIVVLSIYPNYIITS